MPTTIEGELPKLSGPVECPLLVDLANTPGLDDIHTVAWRSRIGWSATRKPPDGPAAVTEEVSRAQWKIVNILTGLVAFAGIACIMSVLLQFFWHCNIALWHNGVMPNKDGKMPKLTFTVAVDIPDGTEPKIVDAN
jgi:hypothetical protein